MSNLFSNYGVGDLADLLGDAKADLRGAKARVSAIETELARRGVVEALGSRYQIKRSRFDRMDPDRDKLKAELGERWGHFLRPVPITRWSATEVRVEQKAA